MLLKIYFQQWSESIYRPVAFARKSRTNIKTGCPVCTNARGQRISWWVSFDICQAHFSKRTGL